MKGCMASRLMCRGMRCCKSRASDFNPPRQTTRECQNPPRALRGQTLSYISLARCRIGWFHRARRQITQYFQVSISHMADTSRPDVQRRGETAVKGRNTARATSVPEGRQRRGGFIVMASRKQGEFLVTPFPSFDAVAARRAICPRTSQVFRLPHPIWKHGRPDSAAGR